MQPKLIINHTKSWLSSFIIHYNICPFAKHEYNRESIHYEVIESADLENCLKSVYLACIHLDTEIDTETSLIIFPTTFSDFDHYLDFLELAESLLYDQGYEGIYQLASFHPDYCFEGEKQNDPANYTNRSPYPMLHLIREISIEKALNTYPHPERIPERNIKLARQLGRESLQTILQKCYR